jgi:hypothetical protein
MKAEKQPPRGMVLKGHIGHKIAKHRGWNDGSTAGVLDRARQATE